MNYFFLDTSFIKDINELKNNILLLQRDNNLISVFEFTNICLEMINTVKSDFQIFNDICLKIEKNKHFNQFINLYIALFTININKIAKLYSNLLSKLYEKPISISNEINLMIMDKYLKKDFMSTNIFSEFKKINYNQNWKSDFFKSFLELDFFDYNKILNNL